MTSGRRTFLGLGLAAGVATLARATGTLGPQRPTPRPPTPRPSGDPTAPSAGTVADYATSAVHRNHPLEFRLDSSFVPDLSDRAAARLVAGVSDFMEAEHPDGLTMTFWDLHPRQMPFLTRHLERIVEHLFRAVGDQRDVRPVDPLAVLALLYNESRFHPKVVSPAGATGMAQLMPETALELGLAPTARPDLWTAFREARAAHRAARALAIREFRDRHGGVRFDADRVVDRALDTGDLGVLREWVDLRDAPDPSEDALRAYVEALESAFAAHEFFWDGLEPLGALDARVGYAAVGATVRYLARELRAHQGLASTAVAAYNAGPSAVRGAGPRSILHRFGELPNYAETVRYVQRFLAVYSAMKYRVFRLDEEAPPAPP